MTLTSRVLVVTGGITVLAVGTAVIVIATPALAAQASATAVSYALANGCLILKEVLSGIFSAGAIWYLWDYLRPCSSSSSSRAHRHRHESHLVPVQPYHTGGWEPDSIALSPRPRTSFQSHHSQHRGRPRSNSVISLLSEFELELPVSVFDTPRSPALAGTPFSVDARSRASSRSRSPAATGSGYNTGSASPAWTLDETTRSEMHGVTTIIDSYVQRGLRQRFSGV